MFFDDTFFINRSIINTFFGDDDTEENTENETETTTSTTTATTTTLEKKFTQEDLNRFLAEEKRKANKASEKTIKQLEELRKNTQLSEEEKQKLEDRIETIRNDALTKEELTKKEAAKERNKQKVELEKEQKEREKWRKLYEETIVENGLHSAAGSDPDVFNPQQIVDLLQPKTRLIEELDGESGQPTGRFAPKVRFTGKNQEGKEVVLDLTPTDAVKQMKEMTDKYGNLFRNSATGGVGGNNTARTNTNNNIPPTDPAAYREWRKKNPTK